MIKIKNEDLLNASEQIIAHQVNCMGVMGSGVAYAIKCKYPEVYLEYKKLCDSLTPDYLIGTVQTTKAKDDKIIANIFGQRGYGRDKQYTDYPELSSGLITLACMARQQKLSIAIPYGMGCGHGGGDWKTVLPMIEQVFENLDVTDVTLYRKVV